MSTQRHGEKSTPMRVGGLGVGGGWGEGWGGLGLGGEVFQAEGTANPKPLE